MRPGMRRLPARCSSRVRALRRGRVRARASRPRHAKCARLPRLADDGDRRKAQLPPEPPQRLVARSGGRASVRHANTRNRRPQSRSALALGSSGRWCRRRRPFTAFRRAGAVHDDGDHRRVCRYLRRGQHVRLRHRPAATRNRPPACRGGHASSDQVDRSLASLSQSPSRQPSSACLSVCCLPLVRTTARRGRTGAGIVPRDDRPYPGPDCD